MTQLNIKIPCGLANGCGERKAKECFTWSYMCRTTKIEKHNSCSVKYALSTQPNNLWKGNDDMP